MPDYQLGKIYKIWCNNDVYYGSSCEALSRRMAKHRFEYKSKSTKPTNSTKIFDKHGIENCKIELVENFPCNSREELEAREGFYIRNNPCINKRKNRTKKEWIEDNKDIIKEKKKDYHIKNSEKIKDKVKKWSEENKEKISESHKCECGGKFQIHSKVRHERSKRHTAFISKKIN